MAIGDLAELRVFTIYNSFVARCTWGFRAITSDPLWRENIADEWIDALAPTFYEPLAEDTQLLEVVVVDVLPGTAPNFTATPISPIHGGGPLDQQPLPVKVAAVITWYSALQGRSNRGRSYVFGLPQEASHNAEFIESGYVDLLTAFAGDMLGQWGPAGSSDQAELVVISRQENLVVRPEPVGVPILDFAVRDVLHSQRRRQTGS